MECQREGVNDMVTLHCHRSEIRANGAEDFKISRVRKSPEILPSQVATCRPPSKFFASPGEATKVLAHPMQRQHAWLRDILDRRKTHVQSRHRRTNRLGVSNIVPVGLDVGLDELGCHQFDGVTKTLQLARSVVGAAAGLHTDPAGWQVHKKTQPFDGGVAALCPKVRVAALAAFWMDT